MDGRFLFNERLADRRGLSDSDKEILGKVYDMMYCVLKRPFNYCSTHEEVVEKIEALEYTMQFIWGFDQDRDKHTYWHFVKGCECPFYDNMGASDGVRWFNDKCPFHGKEVV